MPSDEYQDLAEEVIEENRYLALASTDGEAPWIAPIEYIYDESGDFFFFSTIDSRHAKHIETNDTVAVAIWGSNQPEYDSELSTSLNGVQIRAKAGKVPEDEYPESVVAGIEAFELPMPPYAVFRLTPQRVYVPVIEDGVNKRVEVEMD